MSMDSNGHEPDKSLTDEEGVMFPSTPVWERGRKRRGFGGRKSAPAAPAEAAPPPVAPEARSFASDPIETGGPSIDDPVIEPSLDRPTMTYGEPPSPVMRTDEPEGLVAPIGARTRFTTHESTARCAASSICACAGGGRSLGLPS